MPTYAYVCKKCSYEFEELQSFNDPVLRKCPKCKQLKLERLISGGAGFIFKGDGFYETDYRPESYKKAAEKDQKKPDSKKDSNESSKSSKDSSDSSKKTESTSKKSKKKD